MRVLLGGGQLNRQQLLQADPGGSPGSGQQARAFWSLLRRLPEHVAERALLTALRGALPTTLHDPADRLRTAVMEQQQLQQGALPPAAPGAAGANSDDEEDDWGWLEAGAGQQQQELAWEPAPSLPAHCHKVRAKDGHSLGVRLRPYPYSPPLLQFHPIHRYCRCQVPRLVLTPLGRLMTLPAEVEMSNRVLRHYCSRPGPDGSGRRRPMLPTHCFARVILGDEDGGKLFASTPTAAVELRAVLDEALAAVQAEAGARSADA